MQNLNANKAKQEFEKAVSNDPLKLNKKLPNSSNTRNIYILLVLIPLLLVISFVFYMIASMDGAMFGSPDDEIDSMISEKMREIINTVDRESGGELSGHIGDSFDKIAFGLKIVPNMDNHNFLLQRLAMVGGPDSTYNGLENS